MKVVGFKEASWNISDKELNEGVIRVSTKDRLLVYMQDELEDDHEDYSSITYE